MDPKCKNVFEIRIPESPLLLSGISVSTSLSVQGGGGKGAPQDGAGPLLHVLLFPGELHLPVQVSPARNAGGSSLYP